MGIKIGDFEFVPASELGYDVSEFTIDRGYFYNEMYDFYREQCQGPLEDIDHTYEQEEEPDLDSNKLTCFGRIGLYKWCSLTSIYSKYSYKKLTEAQNKQNLYHKQVIASGGYQLGVKFVNALNNYTPLANYMRNPIVLNTEEALPIEMYSDTFNLTHFLCSALQQEHHKIISTSNSSNSSNQELSVKASLLAGRDVIIPFVYAEPASLRTYYHLANAVCHLFKANTAYGFFITRIKPSMDGKMPTTIEDEYKVPTISQVDELDFWSNILSQIDLDKPDTESFLSGDIFSHDD